MFGFNAMKKLKDITKLQKSLLKEMNKIGEKYKTAEIDYETNKDIIINDIKTLVKVIYKEVEELKNFTSEEKFKAKHEITKRMIKEFKKFFPDLKKKSSTEIKKMFGIPDTLKI